MRQLSAGELNALQEFAQHLPPRERGRLEEDLKNCQVKDEEKADGGTRLILSLGDYVRPKYVGQHAYPVEGVVLDADGTELTVCIYADQNDRLLELEILKIASPGLAAPNWDSFSIWGGY